MVVPRGDVADGIQAVRTMFPRFVFDSEKCYEGVEALKAYRRAWNETQKTWADHPEHRGRATRPMPCARFASATARTRRPCQMPTHVLSSQAAACGGR